MTREEKNRFAAARRRAIEREFSSLNDMQREAALATQGPLLVLAGAGSGKTTVLINRIANLLRFGRASDSADVPPHIAPDDLKYIERYNLSPPDGGLACDPRAEALCRLDAAAPWRVMAITFTNKAANEIKERLERTIGPEAADIWAMTFHSACVRILRRDIERIGYGRSFAIYDAADSLSVVKRVLRDLNMDEKAYAPRSVLGEISRAKDRLVPAGEYCLEADKTGDMRKRGVGKAYAEYEKRLKSANALDFDDLLLLAVRVLTEHKDALDYYRDKFRYLMIDEYQDTNNLQYRLAQLLAGGHGNICAVGDDDQSIYKFRGATIANILNFESTYPGARVIRLEENYRSTEHILAAANDVIRNNSGRRGKRLWTQKKGGEKPQLRIAGDEREEASFVAGCIVSGVSSGGKWSDWAVLYRMNAQSNQLEYALRGAGIPYRVLGGMSFFERAEIKDMLSYLCVINNPSDDLRLLRIINAPPRGIGQRTVDTVAQLGSGEGRSLFAIMQDCAHYEQLRRASAKLGAFCSMISHLREIAAGSPLAQLYDGLIEHSGYVRALEDKNSDESMSRIENVRELKTNIMRYADENPGGGLDGFLAETALYTDLDRADAEADRVALMTVHSAKGLEFDNVIISGADEGIFPGARAIGDPDEMEEERRLCYVAITRARNTLRFVSARRRTLFGKTAAARVSRFVDEISQDNIERPASSPGAEEIIFEDTRYERSAHERRSPDRRGGAPRPPLPAPKNAPPAADFKVGQSVRHKVFGRGLVTLSQAGGSDALLEIAFDSGGTRRFMRNTVAQYLEILD
ncbi:MAG: UvrD-helicase domain-containing protein [Oscillospiraceae bacterium]|jgi:DNA helicase-2/ATP-dependent DNA helicase PcrA|nr:UvrD-helicase domain-containing protein [Oscillospiraceae bacterium]